MVRTADVGCSIMFWADSGSDRGHCQQGRRLPVHSRGIGVMLELFLRDTITDSTGWYRIRYRAGISATSPRGSSSVIARDRTKIEIVVKIGWDRGILGWRKISTTKLLKQL